jgi:hypothetical protein
MNAPPFPLNPAVGERFGNWVWNGSRWVSTRATGIQVITQVFDTPGAFPYQPSPGLVTAIAECVGGGGGGGGATSGIAAPDGVGWLQSGGGGASGGYSKKTLPAALVLGGVVVTVGAPGAAGAPTGAGGTGGDTSFGAFCLAKGGGGGQPGFGIGGSGATSAGAGGARAEVAAGQPGIGDIAVYGNGGEPGLQNYFDPAEAASGQSICYGGRGGGSYFQSAETSSVQGPDGNPGGTGYFGAGGGGAVGGGQGPGPQPGGAGGAGITVVTEYCWGDAGDVDCLDPNLVNVNARVTVEREWRDHGRPPRPGTNGPPAGFLDDPNAYGGDE